MKELQLATMRQVGGSAHAGLKYMSQAEYEMIRDDKQLKDVTYRILVGAADDVRLRKVRTEVSYYEDSDAKLSFCYPEEGRMPEAENEIVLSDIVLNALGVPQSLGEKLTLSMNIKGETKAFDFVLCGFYRGDSLAMAQSALVSRTFQEKYAPTKMTPDQETGNDYEGTLSIDFNFSNSFNIQKKMQDLIERYGFDETTDFGINWAYVGSSIDPSVALICVLLLFTFFAAGYLIIYNIFYLNIVADTQEYGLLKTIGTTGRQIKKIVLKKAGIICAAGIPIGLILGIGLGTVLLPVISGQFVTVGVDKGQLHMNLWIIIGAVFFSYMTVLFSALKPCRKAASVSPIEALRYNDARGEDGKPKRKIFVVILSLSLALVILNCVYAFITGFSMDEYVENMVVADFSVQDAALDNPGAAMIETEGVDRSFANEVNKLPGVESAGNVYIRQGRQEFDEEGWQKVKERLFSQDAVKEKLVYYNRDLGEDFNAESYLAQMDDDKTLDGSTYGMCESAVKKLDVADSIDGAKEIDWDKFNTGDYVLATRWDFEEEKIEYLKPGEKVYLRSFNPEYMELKEITAPNGYVYQMESYDNAPVKEYVIYAVVDIPYALGLQRYGEFDCNFILPEQEFLSLNGDCNAMRCLIDVDSENEKAVGEWLENYTESVDPMLSFKSKDSIVEEYKSFGDMFAIVGGVISLILGLIGLLNFANTMITSILVRSRELAMLEAVGMTGRQQRHSLMKEGFSYFVYTAITSCFLASLSNVTLLRVLSDASGMFEWHFTLTPLFVCLPLICILILIIPVLAYMNLSRRSVVDRLRQD